MIPNKTPMTKSQAVIATMMLAMVKYSVLLTRWRVSQSASLTRSIPSTKMSALTTMTAVTRVLVSLHLLTRRD